MTGMPDIPQPHDSLIRYAFSVPDIAASIFKGYLPPAIASGLDWSGIRPESGSFIDEDLRRSECDLLYRIPVAGTAGGEVFIHLLFEHQSTPDPDLPRRLLRYKDRIWERCRRENPSRLLPLILPVALAQVEGGWPFSTEFSELLAWPAPLRAALQEYQIQFEFVLIDLWMISFDDLRGNEAPGSCNPCSKRVRRRDLVAWVKRTRRCCGRYTRIKLLRVCSAMR